MGKDVKKILYAVKKNAWYKGCEQNITEVTRKSLQLTSVLRVQNHLKFSKP